MSFQDRIELELSAAFKRRLKERSAQYRAWLDASLYGYELDDTLLCEDVYEFKCGHSTYGYRLIAYDKNELLNWIDMLCDKIEKHMFNQLKALSGPKVSFDEESINVNLGYRYIEITFRYKLMEW